MYFSLFQATRELVRLINPFPFLHFSSLAWMHGHLSQRITSLMLVIPAFGAPSHYQVLHTPQLIIFSRENISIFEVVKTLALHIP